MSVSLRQESVGLYVHVPFCERRCHFCAFFTRGIREAQVATFVNDLLWEIQLYGRSQALRARVIESIYLGGGTPTSLSADQLRQILQACRTSFLVDPVAEINIEANPSGLDEATCQALREAGFNRLSLGAQSFDTAELKSMGSPHTPTDIERTVQFARHGGFSNLNLDLIYGLPTQSLGRLEANVDCAIALEPEHISFYGLTVEKGTRLAHDAEAGRVILASDELMAEMSERGSAALEAAGYHQYEVSNFARSGFICRHNLGYWIDREWLGLGPAAHSYLDRERFSNVESLDAYHASLLRDAFPVVERDHADEDLRLREAFAFGLRLASGVDWRRLQRRYGVIVLERFRKPIEAALSLRWLQFRGNYLCATRLGLTFADDLGCMFIYSENT
jgi:oxygen-independent coproporphyrinogen-3 oxidase